MSKKFNIFLAAFHIIICINPLTNLDRPTKVKKFGLSFKYHILDYFNLLQAAWPVIWSRLEQPTSNVFVDRQEVFE